MKKHLQNIVLIKIADVIKTKMMSIPIIVVSIVLEMNIMSLSKSNYSKLCESCKKNTVMEYFDKCEDCLIEEANQIEFEERFNVEVDIS